ncbi:hypothetical protein N798_09715 [Knoellia flava TL1]|uniref:Uncharacterized protein n=2 Tax=Knoellia flava TaxID=913969 RepID=A0A8H9FUC4_9MICO|nr:hypothetical protein [Knoellia flava]KGN31122.1 hypothetical protein N798_09715 [Knoellia flava TL1]GGB82653.1 hypothetical protein GCM10011314_22830 [Knoellia flava]
MTTQLEDQLRDILRDAPEPDWHAFRVAVDERAGRQRRARMLRGSLSGLAAAAAAAAIAIGLASSPLFEGQRARPAVTGTPSPSSSPSVAVPDTTAFQPKVRLANGRYTMPMDFPDVAPRRTSAPEALTRTGATGLSAFSSLASAPCLTEEQAAQPQPWGSSAWDYDSVGAAGAGPDAGVELTGWPTGTASTAMRQQDENSGACAFDTMFAKVGWPGLDVTLGNQFVVDAPEVTGGKRYAAVRRVGDVTVSAWAVTGGQEASLSAARRLVDGAVAGLLRSKVLESPTPVAYEWPNGMTEASPDGTEFILPAIAPSPATLGLGPFVQQPGMMRSAMGTVPVFGAQVGDPVHPGEKAIAVREAEYVLSGVGQESAGVQPQTNVVWSSFPDGQKAFDEIVANRGTARWYSRTQREPWVGHDAATTFLATQEDTWTGSFAKQVALRLEGDVLIAVVSQAKTQAEARSIATRLADEAAANLAAFGRGPDGRPGNGR